MFFRETKESGILEISTVVTVIIMAVIGKHHQKCPWSCKKDSLKKNKKQFLALNLWVTIKKLR